MSHMAIPSMMSNGYKPGSSASQYTVCSPKTQLCSLPCHTTITPLPGLPNALSAVRVPQVVPAWQQCIFRCSLSSLEAQLSSWS